MLARGASAGVDLGVDAGLLFQRVPPDALRRPESRAARPRARIADPARRRAARHEFGKVAVDPARPTIRPEVTAVPRWTRIAMLASLLALAAARQGHAALLSLTVLSGLVAADGSLTIPESIAQESLSGSTLTQLGSPGLYDPDGLVAITVRISNISDIDVLFPDVLPGVSVLTGVFALPGYSSRQNVAAGGNAGRSGAAGSEGAISRTALDLTEELVVMGSPVSGSHGGGGGAGTGVDDNWISVTGASGFELAAYIAGIRLRPGDWVDVPSFIRIASFRRSDEGARIAVGFDLPTFSFGGFSVTTGAWTGAFLGPAPPGPPPAVPEPGTFPLAAAAGLAGWLGRRRL
jgi:hypothetical protein